MSFKHKKNYFDAYHCNAKHYGVLKYKQFSITLGRIWKEVYGIITYNGMFYLFNYPLEKAQKVIFSISLKEINRIESVFSSTEHFAFAFIPCISTKSVTMLAALNERDLSEWMKMSIEIKDAALLNGSCCNKDIDNYETSFVERPLSRKESISEYEKIYDSISVQNVDIKSENTEFVNDLIVFDDEFSHSKSEEVIKVLDQLVDLNFRFGYSEATNSLVKQCKKLNDFNVCSDILPLDNREDCRNMDFVNDNYMENLAEFNAVCSQIKTFPVKNNHNLNNADFCDENFNYNDTVKPTYDKNELKYQSESYYNSVFFCGSKREADELLRAKKLNGVYLVRIDTISNKHYLEVLDDFLVLSYEILYGTFGCKLINRDFHFNNLTFLLYYYSFNKLPDGYAHLEIPFLFVDAI